MRSTLVIVVALRREIASFVAGWNHVTLMHDVSAFTRDHVAVVHAGMGPERVALAVDAAVRTYDVAALMTAGLAGGCDPSVRVGEILRPAEVIDARTGERFASAESASSGGSLVSSVTIAGVREKRRLFDSYAARAVDMEAATVARLARAHGIAFKAVKAISDDAFFEMKELARFATQDGQFREAAFALYAVSRPPMWKRIRQLSANSRVALRALQVELQQEMEQHGIRERKIGDN